MRLEKLEGFLKNNGIDAEEIKDELKGLVQEEIDGAKKEVYILPSIELSDLEGKAVLAKVGETKPFTNAEGKEITPIKANWFEPWEGGVNRDFVEESIPF